MSEPKAFETVPQVIVRENDSEGTIQSKKLQAEMQKNLDKRDWNKAGELAQNVKEINYEGFARRTSSFGVELDKEGKIKRSAEGGDDSEENLAVRVGAVEKVTRKFFELGYAKLDDGEKRMIRESILTQAKRIPLLEKRVQQAIDAGNGDKFAERYINNVAFTGELKAFLNDQLEGDFSNLVIEKYESLKEAEDEEELSKQELEILQRQSEQAQSRLNSFKRNVENGQPIEGAKGATRIDQLRSPENDPEKRRESIASLEQDLIGVESSIRGYEAQQENAFRLNPGINPALLMKEDPAIKPLKTRRGEIEAALLDYDSIMESEAKKDADGNLVETEDKNQTETWKAAKRKKLDAETTRKSLNVKIQEIQEETSNTMAGSMMAGGGNLEAITTELGTARGRMTEIRQRLALLKGQDQELAALEEEERLAQERVKAIEAEKRGALEKRQEKIRDKQKAEREYQAAKEIRLSEEINFTRRLENAWGAASSAIISRQLSEGTAAHGEELEDVKKQSSSAHEEAVRINLMNRWFGNEKTIKTEGLPGKRKKDTSRPFDKVKILNDYSLLLKEGDNALMRRVFKDTINPDTGNNFEEWEINDIYDKNPDLIEKLRPDAVKQLLARKAMFGGFTPEDTFTLTSTEWGQKGVTAAYEQRADFRRAIDQHFGEGALKRHGFWQRFGQEMAKHPFWWTMLLGIPAIFGTIGTEPAQEALDRQR